MLQVDQPILSTLKVSDVSFFVIQSYSQGCLNNFQKDMTWHLRSLFYDPDAHRYPRGFTLQLHPHKLNEKNLLEGCLFWDQTLQNVLCQKMVCFIGTEELRGHWKGVGIPVPYHAWIQLWFVALPMKPQPNIDKAPTFSLLLLIIVPYMLEEKLRTFVHWNVCGNRKRNGKPKYFLPSILTSDIDIAMITICHLSRKSV